MALSTAARRAIAIRNSVAKRAAVKTDATPVTASNDNARTARVRTKSTALLAACVDAGGFDQNARYA